MTQERILSEADLRAILDKAVTDKARDAILTLLSQMDEVRANGGDPICVYCNDGSAFVMDATEMMGN